MEMLALRNEEDIKVKFEKDINFNTFYKPYHVSTTTATTEDGEECIGLKVALSCKYLISQSDTEDEVEDLMLLDKEGHATVLLPKKPEVVMLFSSSQLADSDRDLAATKLQKVYKSYRIRRYLADLAVVCEELWWKDSDSSAFQRCLISHFDSDKSETAISKWATARTIAAKVYTV